MGFQRQDLTLQRINVIFHGRCIRRVADFFHVTNRQFTLPFLFQETPITFLGGFQLLRSGLLFLQQPITLLFVFFRDFRFRFPRVLQRHFQFRQLLLVLFGAHTGSSRVALCHDENPK